SARRYIAFAALARKYPKAKLVFSGGSSRITPLAGAREAEVAKQALASLGVPVEKMAFEDASRNTRENAVFSYNLVHPQGDETWLLVTSAF
ncbi:YdcF family protein, partial [Acinetobacter baumannii]